MEFILTFIFLFLCVCIAPKFSIAIKSGLSSKEIRLLFMFKVCAGLFLGYFFSKIIMVPDYYVFNEGGKEQLFIFKTHPVEFFTDIFNNADQYENGGLFEASGSFWAEFRFTILFKILGIIDLLTGGNFLLNSMVFSSLVFWGHLAFYVIFKQIYPKRKWILLASCFLLPSMLAYTACAHKDGIVFLSLAFASFAIFNYFALSKVKPGLLAVFISSLGLIFLLRNYLVIALLPALLTAIIYKFVKTRRLLAVVVSYVAYVILFFISGNLTRSLNLPEALIKRKADFALLEIGSTNLPAFNLNNNFFSFLGNLPLAVNHAFLRPYLWEFKGIDLILVCIEIILYQLIFILFLFFRKKEKRLPNAFNVFGVCFFITVMLIIGYCIPNAGAIVRYRSIIWIFVLAPMICNIDWERFKTKFLKRGSEVD
jgi:hypothetical protein